MELRREILVTIGALVVLNLCLAFGAIGLFVRMGPAIERIMEENVYSMYAAEEILTELAASGSEPLSESARVRLRAAIERAKRNITESEEGPVLASLERNLPALVEGDVMERQKAVSSLRDLNQINRVAMRSAHDEARRLGSAGAWAGFFVGALSFLLSLFVVIRLQRRFVRPLVDLHEVLEGARHGDRLRRCRLSEAPREVIQVTESVNKLLDDKLHRESKCD